MPTHPAIGVDFVLDGLRIGRPASLPGLSSFTIDQLHLPPDALESRRMLARFVAANRLVGAPAMIGIPSETVFLDLLPLPPGGRQARDAAVREHLEGLHALSGSETVSDVLPLPAAQGQRRLLVGVARRDALCAIIEPLESAGMRVVGAIPTSLALFNLAAAWRPHRTMDLVVLCPIAGEGTEVLVGSGGQLRGLWRLPPGLCDSSRSDPALQALTEGLETDRQRYPERASVPRVLVWCGDTPLPVTVRERIAGSTGRAPVSIAEWNPDGSSPDNGSARVRGLVLNAGRSAPPCLNLLPSPIRLCVNALRFKPGCLTGPGSPHCYF